MQDPEKQPREPQHLVHKKEASYRLRPPTFLGGVLAFVFTTLLLIATFFFSLVIFSILLTATLFFLAYAWWLSRRIRSRKRDPIDAASQKAQDKSRRSNKPF